MSRVLRVMRVTTVTSSVAGSSRRRSTSRRWTPS
jgi:hypothetical protein